MKLDEQKQIQKHFERMYQAGQKPWRNHLPQKSLEDFFRIVKKEVGNAKILDIGCGDGWISIIAAKEGHEVLGIDSSPSAIKEAMSAANEKGLTNKLRFEVGDALGLPYDDNFFDAVIDRGLFHHILPQNREIYLQNILRVLKKKSLVYLSVFSKNNPVGIGQLFNKKKIEEIFGKVFSIVYFNEDPYLARASAHLMHFILKRNSKLKIGRAHV